VFILCSAGVGQGSRIAPSLELRCRWSLLWAARRDREQVDESVREYFRLPAGDWVSSELGRALLLLPDN
jgi:hypothetical protein